MSRLRATLLASACLCGTAFAQAVNLPNMPAAPPPPAMPGAAPATTPAMPGAAPATMPAMPGAAPSTAPMGAVPSPATPAVSAGAALPAVDTSTPAPDAAAKPEETVVPAKSGIDMPGLSFGDQSLSLLFTSTQISAMKQALTAAETHHPETAPAALTILPAATTTVAPKIEEPSPYPAFHLGSIVYHSASDWTVFVAGKRITPTSNTGEITVTGIAPGMARFDWKPAYIKALYTRQQLHKFAPTAEVRNRQAGKGNALIDATNGVVIFALKPNETFDSSRFTVYEGNTAPSNDMPPLADAAPPKSETQKLTDEAKAVLNDLGGAVGNAPAPAPTNAALPPGAPSAAAHAPSAPPGAGTGMDIGLPGAAAPGVTTPPTPSK